MIIEDNKLFFPTALVVLDDAEAMRVARSGTYSRVTIISHTELPLDRYRIQRKETGLIDLKSDLEAVLTTFSKTTRNEIMRTFRNPDFRFDTHDDVPRNIYAMYAQFCRSVGQIPFSRRALRSCGSVGGYDRGELVCGTIFFRSTPIVRIRSIFSKRYMVARGTEGYKRIGYAARRVIAEVCRWGIEHGCNAVDLATVHAAGDDSSGNDESYFKLSFNPRIVPAYTFTYTSPVRRFLERLYPARIVSMVRRS